MKKRPKSARCKNCGARYKVAETGKVPDLCPACRRERQLENLRARKQKQERKKQRSRRKVKDADPLTLYVRKVEQENQKRKAKGLRPLSYGEYVLAFEKRR